MTDARGVDLEIFETADPGPQGVIYPNRIVIDGVELMTPEGAEVTITTSLATKPAVATITFYCRSVHIHANPAVI
jgi:hypothetical protein